MSEMLADLELDVHPSCKCDFDTLIFCFCAESTRCRAGSPDGNRRGSGRRRLRPWLAVWW